jgi:hypothetical protein
MVANGEGQIDRSEASAVNLSKSATTYTQLADRADSPPENDLDRWFTATTQAAEETWVELVRVESLNSVAIIGIGLLLLVTLIGFAVICWAGVGWVYDSILMPK